MDEKLKLFIKTVKGKVRVTKVTCSRTVRGQHGDEFVAFSIGNDSVEDVSGEVSQPDQAAQGMTLREARIAGYLLAMQTDIAAFEHALAGGLISAQQAEAAIQKVKGNYYKLMQGFWKEVTSNGRSEQGEPATDSGQ